MSFSPVIPADGYAGWLMLKRTLPVQQKLYSASAVQNREAEYFRKNIAKVTNAADLVADRTLLKVALTAFGLEQDINSKAFLKKILSDGTATPTALSNRLADKSYLAFANSFRLDGTQLPATLEPDFADKLLVQYYARGFEAALGEAHSSYRLALNAEREIALLAASPIAEDTKWFTVMGNKPLRAVFETALGLPKGFGRIDIDQQLKVLKSLAQSQFGDSSFSQFSQSEKMDKLVRNYLIRETLTTSGASPAQNALQLLGSAARR